MRIIVAKFGGLELGWCETKAVPVRKSVHVTHKVFKGYMLLISTLPAVFRASHFRYIIMSAHLVALFLSYYIYLYLHFHINDRHVGQPAD